MRRRLRSPRLHTFRDERPAHDEPPVDILDLLELQQELFVHLHPIGRPGFARIWYSAPRSYAEILEPVRFLKFALVGLSNTAITFAVFNLLAIVLGLPVLPANALAWVAGFANSFIWNRSWTFGDRTRLPLGRVLTRFAASSLVALAVSTVVIASLDALLRHGHGVGRLNALEGAAVAAALVVNYFLSSQWVFREAQA